MNDINIARSAMGLPADPASPAGPVEPPAPLQIPEYEQSQFDEARAAMGLPTSIEYQKKNKLPSGDPLASAVAASDDPMQEITRLRAADYVSKMMGVPVAHAYANLDAYSKTLYSATLPPQTLLQRLAADVTNGEIGNQIGELGAKLRDSYALAWKPADQNAAVGGYMGGVAPGDQTQATIDELTRLEKSRVPSAPARTIIGRALDIVLESAPTMAHGLMEAAVLGTAAKAGALILGAEASPFTAGLSMVAAAAAMKRIGTTVGVSEQLIRVMGGQAYWRMLQGGVPHDAAAPLSQIEGVINGALESAGELFFIGAANIPGLRAGIKTVGQKIAEKFLVTGAAASIAARMATRLGTVGGGEGLENALQEAQSMATDQLALEWSRARGSSPELASIDTKTFFERFGQAFVDGLSAGVVFGVVGLPAGVRLDARHFSAIRNLAVAIPDKAQFVEAASKFGLTGSGVSPAAWKDYLGKVWDTQQSRVQAQIQERNATTKPGAAPTPEAAKAAVMGPLTRTPEGTLDTRIIQKGSSKEGTNAILVTGDAAKGERYGYLKYETVGETVYIRDVVSESAAQDVTREMILDLLAKNPGKAIEWNPTDEAGVALKEDLIASNRLGSLAGVNPFAAPVNANTADVTVQPPETPAQALTRDYLEQQATKLYNLTPEQAPAYMGLWDAVAKNLKMPTDEFIGRYVTQGVVESGPGAEAVLHAGGGIAAISFSSEGKLVLPMDVDRAEFIGRTKATFSALQGADFHHAISEFFHMVERLALTPEQTKLFERAFGKLRETWTVADVERAADLFETYLSTGQAPTAELRTLFQQIAEILNNIVSFLKEMAGRGEQGLSPEFEQAYDALFTTKQIRKPVFARVNRADVTMPLERQIVEPHAPEPLTATIVDPRVIPPGEIDISLITLSPDVPQFKEDANAEGVVEKLTGKKYRRLPIQPIVVWERASGAMELVTGRHRFDLAKRLGEISIPAQIVRESEGFTAEQAVTLDVESNILDGQGSVKDYATYFKNTDITEEEANSRGLLDRDKGRKGFAIGKYATPGLYTLYRSGEIGEVKAAAIAAASRGDPRLTDAGIKSAKTLSAEAIVQQLEILRTFAPSGADIQVDIFGNEIYEESAKLAQEQVKKVGELRSENAALKGATKLGKAEAAKVVSRYGFQAGDTKAMAGRIAELDAEITAWADWKVDPAKMAELRQRAGIQEATALFHPLSDIELVMNRLGNIAHDIKRTTNKDRLALLTKVQGDLKKRLADYQSHVGADVVEAKRAVYGEALTPASAAAQAQMEREQALLFASEDDLQVEGPQAAKKPDTGQFSLFHVGPKAAETDPSKMAKSDFIPWAEYNKVLRRSYVNAEGKLVASSRTQPAVSPSLTLGQWMVDDFEGIHGHDIAQLRALDPYALVIPEGDLTVQNFEGRGDDARRYAEWIAQGLTPPPITVVETTDTGKLQVSNGHRRTAAAKLAGQKVLAWVYPNADDPRGRRMGGDGPVMRVGLTYEMATGRDYETDAPVEQKALYHPAPPEDFSLTPLSDAELELQRAKEKARAAGKAAKASQGMFGFADKTDVQMKDEKDQMALFHAAKGIPLDPDSLSREVLSKMDRALKAWGYDTRGPDDVLMMMKSGRVMRDGVLWHPEWIVAYERATESAVQRKARAAAKKTTQASYPNINWERIREMGVTSNPKEGAYIRPDGLMVDGSGKNMGGQPGERALDHREAGGTIGMQEFVAYGNIRMDENAGMLDIGKNPTSQQLLIIERMAARKNGALNVELTDGLGELSSDGQYYRNPERTFYQEYPAGTRPARIVLDIQKFYAGEAPVALFHPDMENADGAVIIDTLIRKAAHYDTAAEFQKDMEEMFGEPDPAAAERYQRIWGAAHPPAVVPTAEAPKGIPLPEEVAQEYDYNEKLTLAREVADPVLAQAMETGNVTEAQLDKAGTADDAALRAKLVTAQAKIDEALASFTPEEQYILTLADELSTLSATEATAKRMKNKIASLRGRLKTALGKNARLSLLVGDMKEGFRFDEQIEKAIADARVELQKAEGKLRVGQVKEAANANLANVKQNEADRRLEQKARMYAERRAAMAKFRDQVRAAMAERRAVMKYRETRKKLIRAIMAPPSTGISFRGYADRIQEIQQGLDPATHRAQTELERKASRAFFDANPEAAALAPRETIERIYSVPMQGMSLAQLEEIHDLVEGLRKLGGMKRSLELVQRKRGRETSKGLLVNTVLRGEAPEDVVGAAKPTGVPMKAWLMGLKPGRVAQLLDGIFAGNTEHGAFWRILQDRPNEAWKAMVRRIEQRHESVISQLDGLKVTLDLFDPRRLTGFTYVGGTMDIGGFKYTNGKEPTFQQVMYWYLGMKNDKTRPALLSGNHLPIGVVEAGIAALPKNLVAVADLISKDFNDNFPRYRDAYIDSFNAPLEAEQNYVTMNRLEISYMNRDEKLAAELTGRSGLTKRYVDRGSTHARIEISDEHQKPIATDLMSVWMEAVRDQEGFIYQDTMIKDMHAVLESDEVRHAVQQKYGPELNKWLKKYINDLAQADAYQAQQGIEKWSRIARSNAAIAWLAFNVLTNLKQLVGWVNALADAGPLHLVSAAAQFAAGQGKSILKGKLLGNTLVDFVEERSELIRHRQISQELEDMRRLNAQGYEQLVKKVGHMGMKSLEVIDKVSCVIGWKGVYDRVMAKTHDEAAAIKAADEATVRTQPSMRVQDMAEMYRGGEALKWFTMFTSDLNATWNRMVFDVPAALRNGQVLSAFADVVSFGIAGAGIAIASGALGGDDDEKKKHQLALGAFSQYFSAIPFIGSDVLAALSGKTFQSGGVKLFPAITYLQQIPADIKQGQVDQVLVDLAKAAAFGAGLPVSGPTRAVKAFTVGDWQALLGWPTAKKE